jgi:hypothetical protein
VSPPYYLLFLYALYVAPSFYLHCSSMFSSFFVQLFSVICLHFSCCSFTLFFLHCSFVVFSLLIHTLCIALPNFWTDVFFNWILLYEMLGYLANIMLMDICHIEIQTLFFMKIWYHNKIQGMEKKN